MSRAEDFILNTDFATMKGDARLSTSVLFPSSVTIPAASVASYSSDLNIGTKGSIIRSKISSNRESNLPYACTVLSMSRQGTIPSFPGEVAFYTLYCVLSRISPETIRAYVIVPNFQSVSIRTSSTSETITFNVSTFIPPFI